MIPLIVLSVFFAFSSFAFGCMEGWAIAACEVILFLGAAWAGWRDREFWRPPRRLWLPALLVVVLAVIGLLQLVPLPVSLWRAAHAERVAIYDEGAKAEALLYTDAYTRNPFAPVSPHGSQLPSVPSADSGHSSSSRLTTQNSDLSSPSAFGLPPSDLSPHLLTPAAPSWLPASFTPMDTARAVVALCAGLCLILLLERLSGDRENLKRLLLVVGLLGVAVAAVALVQYAEKRTALLWVRPSPWAERAFGPFVNANHGEAFVNLAFPCLYYLLWRRSRHERKAGNRWGLRIMMAGLFGLHGVLLAVSHSRAAFLALALYPVAILLHLGWQGKRGLALAGLVGAAALVVGVVVVARLGLVTSHGRWPLLKNVPIRHVVLGQGLGSFETRFPAVVTDYPLTFTTKVNTHLENEYGQVFFEAGTPALLLALASAAWIILLSVRGLKWGHACFWLAPALVSETAHAAVDFTGHVFPVVGAFLLVTVVMCRRENGAADGSDPDHRRRNRHSPPADPPDGAPVLPPDPRPARRWNLTPWSWRGIR